MGYNVSEVRARFDMRILLPNSSVSLEDPNNRQMTKSSRSEHALPTLHTNNDKPCLFSKQRDAEQCLTARSLVYSSCNVRWYRRRTNGIAEAMECGRTDVHISDRSIGYG